jgi:2-polyprenyl-6-hydroxyphenyl methylase/3-demethylubiquinone-9 3-methyltransferase
MSAPELRYRFGANWKDFVATALNEARIANAVASMRQLLGVETLAGETFMDIGCGSGLFSLAACLLDAERVISFDIDADSVATSRWLRDEKKIPGSRWAVEQGSVMDAAWMASLPACRVVYSWGVLHHTGRMYDAIDAAVGKVGPGGQLAISIYNRVERKPDSSAMWWKIKRFYNQAPRPVRGLMEAAYVANHAATRLITLRNPFPAYTDTAGDGRRGMDFMHDVRDWLGGFPYEYATAGELFAYVHRKHGLTLEWLRTGDGNICNEFLFRRPAAAGA